MMKKVFLGAAAILATAPVAAHAETSGYAGGSYTFLSDDNDDTKDGSLALGGAIVSTLGGNWVVQLDASEASLMDNDYSYGFGQATLHAAYRTDSYAFGGFVGLLDEDAGYGRFTIGAEGQAYFSNFTLSGAVAYDDLIDYPSSSSDDTSSWSVDAHGDYFVMPNFSIGASIGYWDNGEDWWAASNWNYGVNAEYQISGSPVSLFAGYKHYDVDYDSGGDNEVDAVQAGFRLNFGTGDLQERSKTGASLVGGQDAIGNYEAIY